MEYKAQIEYNKQNIMRMANVVCYAFEKTNPDILRYTGILLGAVGLYRILQYGDGLPILIAAVLIITNADVRGKALGRKMCAFMEDWWPTMKLCFNEKSVTSETNREKTTVAYENVIQLMEDRDFLYVFTSKTSAFMVDKKTIQPEGAERLKLFLTEKTGLTWIKTGGIRLMSKAKTHRLRTENRR